jgi:hypothetical protein
MVAAVTEAVEGFAADTEADLMAAEGFRFAASIRGVQVMERAASTMDMAAHHAAEALAVAVPGAAGVVLAAAV